MSAICNHLWRHWLQRRNYLVRGAGAQDACVVTLLKSPWLMHPSLLSGSLPHGRRCCGEIRCAPSSVWKNSSVLYSTSVDSGKAQTIVQLWEEYFADPLQWWDDRVYKMNLEASGFKHKETKKMLWVDDSSTPLWVKAALKLVTQTTTPSHVGYRTTDFQEIVHLNRLPKGSSGRRNTLLNDARGSKQTFRVGGGGIDMRSVKSTSEAIDILKNRLHQGIAIGSNMYVEVLKRCLKRADLAAVEQVHKCVVESGMQQNTYVANNLLSAYIRCGRLEDACRVFDELVEKDVFSWTSMIGGYAKHSCAEGAMEVFKQMRQAGVPADAITYLSMLKAFSSPSALQWGKEIHASTRYGGYESDVRVGTAVLKMYAKCGSMKDARITFEKLASRNIISWNVMIGAYAESDCGEEAYRLFLQMRREGLKPNAVTYLSLLKSGGSAGASPGALEWLKKVHSHAREGGLESDVRVGNALVHKYAKCGSIDDAQLVFDRMGDRNVITWTAMIGAFAGSGRGEEAYRLFLQMIQKGFQPDAVTYVSILNACASTGALEWVKKVHSHARERGFESDARVGNALVRMYAKCGSIDGARLVFDRMEHLDVRAFTVMIGGLAQNGFEHEAYDLILRMKREGLKPDAFTYASILDSCANVGDLEWVKEVHSHAREGGFESDLRVGNALVHMYAKCDSIDDAQLVFERMEERDVVTWTVMIGAYAETGRGDEAFRLFLRMIQEGFEPNAVTYANILNTCASTGALKWVKEVHSHARERGYESDVRVGNALVHMYAKCGSIDDARLFFHRMEERDVRTWTVMIGAYAENGLGEDAYRLFLQMNREGFKPNAFTYASILNACASAGALEWVAEVHKHAREGGFESDVRVGNALVHMYGKCGSIADAQLVFDKMEQRDVRTWTVMIGGLAQHGFGSEAVDVFRKMIAAGEKPDEYSFVAALSACSHAGLVDEGRELFLTMSEDYGIVPNVVHCSCMVDILGRAGLLEEARVFIDNMQVNPNGATWGALLSACRSFGNVELGELAAKELVKLEPNDASAYVLLSNIYAAAEKWEEVALVRSMMQERGIRREPGRSWIEVNNKIHAFVVGDTSHPDSNEIYAELSRLTEKIKAEGYLPDTQLVLHDVDEKDKEASLCSHSEKLAIAYGLISTPSSSKPIRVFKNLRVCLDCHTATKLISKVTGREVVVRDANRFHHFKDGLCSCKDYW